MTALDHGYVASDLKAVPPVPHLRMEVVTISSEKASAWLEIYKGPNRPLNDSRVIQYQGDMEAGRWYFTSHPLVISETGKLLDGRHRLTAIANCVPGIELPFTVVFGVEDEAQMYMDQPQVRTVGQQLGLKGVNNSTLAAAAAKMYLEWTRGRLFKSLSRGVTSKSEITDWVLEHTDLIDRASATQFQKVEAPPSVVGAFVLRVIQIDPERAVEFMDKLTSGAGLEEGNPILALDRRLRNIRRHGQRVSHREYLAYFIRAWNAWLAGERLSKIQLAANMSEDNFPVLAVGAKVA